MDKNVKISILYEFYNKVLNKKQAEIIDLYYNNNLSLREIAEYFKISPQGVRDSLKRAEAVLLDMEIKLQLFKKYKAQQKVNKETLEILTIVENKYKDEQINNKIQKVKKKL